MTKNDCVLPIRKEPNFETRDAWYKLKSYPGFVSAYRVEGIVRVNKGDSWSEAYDHKRTKVEVR